MMGVFALAPLVDEVIGNESLLSVPDGATLHADIPDDFTLDGDADQIFRVLTNLVRNAVQAIEATGRSGEVRIAASCDGAPEITVSDTGPGLPEKARANLFQPFRGGVRQGGAGLGLVIASELVKGHGGTLDLASTGPGGTTFRISLPRPGEARPGAGGAGLTRAVSAAGCSDGRDRPARAASPRVRPAAPWVPASRLDWR